MAQTDINHTPFKTTNDSNPNIIYSPHPTNNDNHSAISHTDNTAACYTQLFPDISQNIKKIIHLQKTSSTLNPTAITH